MHQNSYINAYTIRNFVYLSIRVRRKSFILKVYRSSTKMKTPSNRRFVGRVRAESVLRYKLEFPAGSEPQAFTAR